MDRLTQIIDGKLCTVVNAGETVEYRYGDDIDRLAAYEDTGLTPAEVVILKAKSEEESFIDHLNMLCDMKDKQISELFIENQRLKGLVGEIERIVGHGTKRKENEDERP